MAKLSLRHIYKVYPSRDKQPSIFKRLIKKDNVKAPEDFVAVKDFNLEINDGEFVVFVGPSGCGKSTTLRMIAGLEDISAGELFMDDVLLNNVDPMNRNMAMVFQSYALYPHLTAYGNIAFGLKMRKIEEVKKDKNGNEIKGIDHSMIKTISKQIRVIEKEIGKLLKNKEKIELLNQQINSGSLNEKQLKGYQKQLENAKEIYSEEKLNTANEKLKEFNQSRDYYSNNEVVLHYKRHYTKQEIDEKVQWAADILGIKELLNRKPSEMSGGQCQRVALGRAIVRGPKVFLLDEPLSNLDAKLRTSMRSEIVKLHQRLNTTFIYVTHDQVEAMTMGTKIVVMKDGVVQQIAKPIDLFLYPNNLFVAGFIGTPQMNFFDVDIIKNNKKLNIKFVTGESIELDISKIREIKPEYLDGKEHKVVLGVRAEHLKVENTGLNMTISLFEILGSTTHLFAHLDGQDKDYIISVDDNIRWESGQKIKVSFSEDKIHLFDKESGESILAGVKEND